MVAECSTVLLGWHHLSYLVSPILSLISVGYLLVAFACFLEVLLVCFDSNRWTLCPSVGKRRIVTFYRVSIYLFSSCLGVCVCVYSLADMNYIFCLEIISFFESETK